MSEQGGNYALGSWFFKEEDAAAIPCCIHQWESLHSLTSCLGCDGEPGLLTPGTRNQGATCTAIRRNPPTQERGQGEFSSCKSSTMFCCTWDAPSGHHDIKLNVSFSNVCQINSHHPAEHTTLVISTDIREDHNFWRMGNILVSFVDKSKKGEEKFSN